MQGGNQCLLSSWAGEMEPWILVPRSLMFLNPESLFLNVHTVPKWVCHPLEKGGKEWKLDCEEEAERM